MKITSVFTALMMSLATITVPNIATAYDNGPQTLACDYTFDQQSGTETCLIRGSGMNQGVTWVVFEVDERRFRYFGDSETIELLNTENEAIATYRVTNTYGQCRPGGREADIYNFANGDRVCLYW